MLWEAASKNNIPECLQLSLQVRDTTDRETQRHGE